MPGKAGYKRNMGRRVGRRTSTGTAPTRGLPEMPHSPKGRDKKLMRRRMR